jgi:hypothetical protein
MARGGFLLKLLVPLATCLLCMILFEIAGRYLIEPDATAYGTLFGRRLPPFAIIPRESPPPTDREAWFDDLVVDGRRITRGDLGGYQRFDPVLGFTNEIDRRSVNGWWQSNNVGARLRRPLTREVAEGVTRALVLGDSFAHGSRVRQEDAWPNILDARDDHLEVVNLGVDGYGMGQAYLLYRRMRERLEHQLVVLMFVPKADLWRDINTLRELHHDWQLYQVLPRFVLENDELRFIPPLYDNPNDLSQQNRPQVSEKLRIHLHKYDRFYFSAVHDDRWPIRYSIILKLGAQVYYSFWKQRLIASLFDVDAEAVGVSKRIFAQMADDVVRRGQRLLIVILPTHHDLRRMRNRPAFIDSWDAMVRAVCPERVRCLDLRPELIRIPDRELDRGLDHTHYGPRANHHIARLIEPLLVEMADADLVVSGNAGRASPARASHPPAAPRHVQQARPGGELPAPRTEPPAPRLRARAL